MSQIPHARSPHHRGLALVFSIALVVTAGAQTLEDALQSALTTLPKPDAPSDFKPLKHLSPLNQDTTLICWSFSTSSFIESEMERLGLPPVRLSVTYPVYCVFLEKAKRYIQTRGNSRFAPGDLFSGVFDIVQQYGSLPASVYGNKEEGKTVFNQTKLYSELQRLMERVKRDHLWNEKNVLPQVRRVLNRHLGEPPTRFSWKGASYTPQSFLREVVRIPWKEYLFVTSFEYAPFDKYAELKVPDNWKRNDNYLNVPLDVFYNSIKDALQAGYSVAIDADISEPSYERTKRYAFIPPYDMPVGGITQDAREFRFVTGQTTDDHLLHIVDYRVFGDEDWFLVKDSWRTAWEPGSPRGYMFFHGSYVKLKVLAYLVHRDGVVEIKKRMEEKQ